jgi:MoaA/NifB/PqqE/SkfB family radical SAM enzyme
MSQKGATGSISDLILALVIFFALSPMEERQRCWRTLGVQGMAQLRKCGDPQIGKYLYVPIGVRRTTLTSPCSHRRLERGMSLKTVGSETWDMLRLIRRGGPALCNVAVTNSCNAICDFCNFANGRVERKDLRWIDADQFDSALQILHGRGVRYVSFFGGEPLLHPRLPDMIAMSVAKGMGPALITNGWLLSSKLDQLAAAGLKTVYISIDAASMSDHEANRGLSGLGERIRKATSRIPKLGMTVLAQVTMSKLIGDYRALVPLLQELGFEAVAFSYPQRTRLGSSSLAWSADSDLMKFNDSELVQAFEAIDDLRNAFRVNNPHASIADMKRHILGEPERFVCYGGYKSFYMDWNFDIWRCDAWRERMCSVWKLATTPLVRDGCTACIADCYRDSSVMLHFAVSLGDALDLFCQGNILTAFRALVDPRNLESLGAVVGNAPVLSRLAKVG